MTAAQKRISHGDGSWTPAERVFDALTGLIARTPSLAIFLVAGAASGATLTWNNAAGGNLTTASNWSPAQTPTSADSLIFSLNNTYTVNLTSALTATGGHTYKRGAVTLNASAAHSTNSIFRIADTATDNAVVTLTTGTLTVNNAVFLGNASGSLGTLAVNDADARFVMGLASGVVIVGLGSTGAINLTNGGRFESAANVVLGNSSVAAGTVQVSGMSAGNVRSMLRTTGTGDNLTVGLSGDGRLDVTGGGIASIGGSVILASSASSSGIVNLTGQPTLSSPSTLEAIDTGSDVVVGQAGHGTLTVRDGGRLTSQHDISIAPSSGSTGVLDIAGTASHISRAYIGNNLNIGVNDFDGPNLGGQGTLVVGANAIVSVGNITGVGDSSNISTNATLRIQGGQLITRSLSIDDFNVFGTTIDFQSGDLIIDGGSIFYSSNAAFGRKFNFGNPDNTPRLTFRGGGHTTLEDMDVGGASGSAGNAAVIITDPGTSLAIAGGTFPEFTVDAPTGKVGSATVSNGASLRAENLKVVGGGLSGTNSMTVDAGSFLTTARIDVAGAGASLVLGGIGTTLTTSTLNVGTFGGSGGSVSLLAGCTAVATLPNTGPFAIDIGDSATLTVDAGATLTTPGGVRTSGTLTLAGGTINAQVVNADMFNNGLSAGAIVASGTINADVAILNAASSVTVTGVLQVGRASSPTGFNNSLGTFIVEGSGIATLLGSAPASLGNTQMLAGSRIVASHGMQVAANRTVSGSGQIDGAVSNSGRLSPSASGLVFTGAVSGVGQGINGTRVTFNSGASFSGTGTINADVFTDAASSIVPSGPLAMGRTASSTGVSIAGTLLVGSNAVTLRDNTTAQLGVLTELIGGSITCASGITLAGGTTPSVLRGSGNVFAPVVNSGRVQPGLSAPADQTGTLVIAGNYDQNPASGAGTIDMQIAGTAQSERDLLAISGAASLGGTLKVRFVAPFVPAPGSTFTLIGANSISGVFASLDIPAGFRVQYAPTHVDITNSCPADFNSDGSFDFFDYLDFVSAFAAGTAQADFNQDGVVDLFDYLDFVSAFSAGC